MLKILFSPSEAKNSGGEPDKSDIFYSNISRAEMLQAYDKIIKSDDMDQISSLFGIKDPKKCQPYLQTLDHCKKMRAIQRYSGVAYQHLAYDDLPADAQEYLQKRVIIFSNLYGPILAKDKICNYKVKQGVNIGTGIPDQFYKRYFSQALDQYLQESDILDLRAGYYDKFYKVSQPYTTLKFLKNGRVVSHFAKAYRGVVLKEIAKHKVSSIEDFIALPLDTLQIKQINKIKNKTEIVYDILS